MTAPGAFARLPLGLLGMVALIALAEVRLSGLRDDLTPMEVASWLRTGQSATSPAALSSDVLFLGDSTVKLGLSPQAFAETSGLSAYNLALPAANAPAEFFLLQRALRAGARPKAVVVAFTPRLLMEDRWKAARFYAEMASLGELIELAHRSGDASFLGSQLVARVIPSARRRAELRGLVLGRLVGRWGSLRNQVRTYARNWDANRGAMMMPPVDDNLRAMVETNRAMLQDLVLPDPWRCERLSRQYVDQLLALAEAHGIPTFWVLAPFQPPPRGPSTAPVLEARREQAARVRRDRYGHLVVIDARQPGYPSDVFLDPVHLDVRGAARFAADLGRIVSETLASAPASRWATLAPRETVHLATLPEDVDASREILKNQWKARTHR